MCEWPLSAVFPVIWMRNSTGAIAAARGAYYVSAISGDLVNDNLVGNPAQRRLLLDRRDRLAVENGGHLGRVDHRPRNMHRLRGRQALHACGDVDGLPEIILALIEHDGEARALMDADLDHQIVSAAL